MPKKGLNQAVIIQAAAGLAEQKGLENITLRELADCLGVKTASLYNHLDVYKRQVLVFSLSGSIFTGR